MEQHTPSDEFLAAAKALTEEARATTLVRYSARFSGMAATLSEDARVALILQKEAEDLDAWRANLAALREADTELSD